MNNDNDIRPVPCHYLPFNNNFGDLLTPLILNSYGVPTYFQNITNGAKLIGIGSILQAMPPRYIGSVWTSGFQCSEQRVHLLDRRVKVWAVRGRETLYRLSGTLDKSEVALGDGGLIVDKWHSPIKKQPSRYKLGVIPHYVDFDVVQKKIDMIHRPDVHLINIQGDPRNIINQIVECENIISSSLHGLIAADCFGIPSAQFNVSTSQKIVGGNFKYRDYYSVFGIPRPPTFMLRPNTQLEPILSHVATYSNRPNIDSVKFNIDQATTKMADYFRTR